MISAAVIVLSVGLAEAVGSSPAVDVFSPVVAVWTEPPTLASFPREGWDAPRLPSNWNGLTLREIARRLGETDGAAILLDRRVDPTRLPELSDTGLPLRQFVEQLASAVDAEPRLIGRTALVAPSASARGLLTVIELRRQERDALLRGRAVEVRRLRTRTDTVSWGDLTRSDEVLDRIAAAYELRILDRERLPTDLLAGAVLPDLDSSACLSLFLSQFELTFAWESGGDAVRLVPLPAGGAGLTIARSFPVRPGTAEASRTAWLAFDPDLQITAEGNTLVVRGTIEQQERLAKQLAGRSSAAKTPPARAAEIPLSRRKFTLSVTSVPASALFATLEQNGMTILVDQNEVLAAGINWQQPVTLDVKQVTAEEFFQTLCGPLGLEFRITGTTVHLQPAGRPSPGR